MAIASSPSRWVSPRLLLCALLLATLGGVPAALPLARSADDAPAAAVAAAAAPEMETRAYNVPLGTFDIDRDESAREVFGGEDDDDDDDDDAEAPELSVTERIKGMLAELGIGFPAGSSLLFSERTQNLVVRTSREEHERLGRLLGWFCGKGAGQIQVNFTVIRIGTQTAADWGLDGLPAGRPETSPFAGPVPRRMSEKQSALFFAALRKTEGFEVFGTTEVTTISGQTANVQGVERERLVESLTEAESVTAEDGTLLHTPAETEFSEEQRFGIQLTVTPTVGDDDYTVDLELRPTYTEIIGTKDVLPGTIAIGPDGKMTKMGGSLQGIPIILEYSVETRVLMADGSSMLIGASQRKSQRDPAMFPHEKRIPTDPRPVFFVLTVSLQSTDRYRRLD